MTSHCLIKLFFVSRAYLIRLIEWSHQQLLKLETNKRKCHDITGKFLFSLSLTAGSDDQFISTVHCTEFFLSWYSIPGWIYFSDRSVDPIAQFSCRYNRRSSHHRSHVYLFTGRLWIKKKCAGLSMISKVISLNYRVFHLVVRGILPTGTEMIIRLSLIRLQLKPFRLALPAGSFLCIVCKSTSKPSASLQRYSSPSFQMVAGFTFKYLVSHSWVLHWRCWLQPMLFDRLCAGWKGKFIASVNTPLLKSILLSPSYTIQQIRKECSLNRCTEFQI